MFQSPPRSPLFPYTTLFRSLYLPESLPSFSAAELKSFDDLDYPALALQFLRRFAPDRSTGRSPSRSEEHTSELQSRLHLVCRLLLEKKKYRISSISSSNN